MDRRYPCSLRGRQACGGHGLAAIRALLGSGRGGIAGAGAGFRSLRGFPPGPPRPSAQDPERQELYSAVIAGFALPDCGPHPAWIAPQEWLGAATARRFPLHLLSVQPADRLALRHEKTQDAPMENDGCQWETMDGAAGGIRTPDPIITNDVLYQLSYCGQSGLAPYRHPVFHRPYCQTLKLPSFLASNPPEKQPARQVTRLGKQPALASNPPEKHETAQPQGSARRGSMP